MCFQFCVCGRIRRNAEIFLDTLMRNKYNQSQLYRYKKLQKGFTAMQNRNQFPQQNMHSVVPVYYVNQGSIADGNDTVLRNPKNPI